jgi:serine/threonine protein kinase
VLNRTGRLELKAKRQCEKNRTAQLDIKNILKEDDVPQGHQHYLSKARIRVDLSRRVVFLLEEASRDKLLSSFFMYYDPEDEPGARPPKDKTLLFKENFLVGKQVGEGAYASVRMALHRPTNTKVAIKIYEKAKIKDSQRRRSVLREIKIMQMVDHPNVVRIIDAVETNNHVNIVMQYLDGESLNSYLKTRGRLAEIEAKSLFLQLLQALVHLHSLNIVHRDIKLENILLEHEAGCCPTFIDFGFSTCMPHHAKLKLFCGTPSYMAPEIVNKEEFSGPPTDIWALGVALWVILVGSFPFKGATDKELFARISRGVCAKAHLEANLGSVLIPSSLSAHACSLLEAMLCTNPDRRPSAGQLILHPWFDEVKAAGRGDSERS